MAEQTSLDTSDIRTYGSRLNRFLDSIDVVGGGIILSAILMFVGTGSLVVPEVANLINGKGTGPNSILATAMLLNIALIIFGWKRYDEMRKEVEMRRRAEVEARKLAVTDPLTNCLNRRSINERTADLIAAAEKREMAVAFLMLDLDHFKTINDIHGHQAGDMVLKTVADRLHKIVPRDALISRLGGDEFAIAFTFTLQDRSVVERIAEQMIEKISLPIDGPTCELAISTSIGIAFAHHSEESAEALLRRADMAMYHSKKGGRNRFSWFESSMHTAIQTQNMLESGMRAGIPTGEFVPYFEQQIDLATGKLAGFEVLARWRSQSLGNVLPDVFIPIAEECNLIAELSESIMRQAFLDAKNWDNSLTLSVNISPFQLRDPWLAQKIIKILTETGFPAERLEVEITENALFENIGLAKAIMTSLRNQGVKVALDDFGTGYSSLSHLRILPFDRIKIDQSFISTYSESPDNAAIVDAIIHLSRSLNLPVTAEGAEDEQIVNFLAELGCEKVQGYHYGQPLSIEQTRWMLARSNLYTMANEPSDGDESELQQYQKETKQQAG
ncbi:putative bifunctional diguanylate cyclase/phosphodiesterase [Parasphingorhabdus sp. DH2-15]|uniref:putative bifunctional diguanylate cyclase/phosphodiesterase n=1 Tax=Parasphingorhabdus sp. DH2-15 TaxID=3444112 RepID=UPI003F6842C4